jgi:hypothetical protein
VACVGSQEEFDGVVRRFHDGPAPLFEFVDVMPYMALQTFLDEANAWGQHYYDKGGYVADLTDEVIDVITDYSPRKHSPQSVTLMYRLDGAYSAVGDDETAFSGGRTPRYGFFIIGISATPDLLPADREWARAFYEAVTAVDDSDGIYVNGMDFDEPDDRVRKAYGAAKYDRLAQIKATYDPTNVFRRNLNIKPAATTPTQRSEA